MNTGLSLTGIENVATAQKIPSNEIRKVSAKNRKRKT